MVYVSLQLIPCKTEYKLVHTIRKFTFTESIAFLIPEKPRLMINLFLREDVTS